jgi:hypothetical protein
MQWWYLYPLEMSARWPLAKRIAAPDVYVSFGLCWFNECKVNRKRNSIQPPISVIGKGCQKVSLPGVTVGVIGKIGKGCEKVPLPGVTVVV